MKNNYLTIIMIAGRLVDHYAFLASAMGTRRRLITNKPLIIYEHIHAA